MFNQRSSIVSKLSNSKDLQKCNDYLLELQNGNYNHIKDAELFFNQKYTELCSTDPELVVAKNIVSQKYPIDNDYINRTINSLIVIRDLLLAKLAKELSNK